MFLPYPKLHQYYSESDKIYQKAVESYEKLTLKRRKVNLFLKCCFRESDPNVLNKPPPCFTKWPNFGHNDPILRKT